MTLTRRYIDDIFMTTNESVNRITKELERAQNKDVNIKIDYKIDVSVNYLDVNITNEDGRLRTSIYHKSAAEPYILPYTSDHPHHIHRNIPYAALLRAARVCSNVEDFDAERVHIDLSLLLNDYSPKFITRRIDRFFTINYAISVFDQTRYQHLHQTLLNQATRREKQLAIMTNNPIESPVVLEERRWDANQMYPRYLFDRGHSIQLPKQFRQWWNDFYKSPGSPVRQVTIRLVADTNKTLEQLFVRKKPARNFLTKFEPIENGNQQLKSVTCNNLERFH